MDKIWKASSRPAPLGSGKNLGGVQVVHGIQGNSLPGYAQNVLQTLNTQSGKAIKMCRVMKTPK